MKRVAVLFLFACCVSAAAFAANGVIEGALSRESIGMKSYPAPPRVAATANAAPAVVVGRAEASARAEMDAWNAAGREPYQNGFTRVLPELIQVRMNGGVASKGGPAAHAGGLVSMSERGIVWSGKFQIDAPRVRLRLDNVKLPDGAVLWIYNDGGNAIAFDKDLIDTDGGIWAPSVRGGVIHLEIETPMPKGDAGAASFDINRFLELMAFLDTPRPTGSGDDASCLLDVQCETATFLHQYKTGVAHLQYVKNNGGFICSGGLMNDSDATSVIPWFLTANHCFSTQASATSLEAYFDWRYLSCVSTDAPQPAPMLGAQLVATNASSDFTFIRLNQITGTHWYFGSDPNLPAAGTTIHRISHPAPDVDGDGFGDPQPQSYSASTLSTAATACSAAPRPQFLYSTNTSTQGGVFGGSSGGVAFLSNGSIVGQLLGSCGPDPSAGCDTRNRTVDGALATTWASISQFLTGTGTGPGGCTPSANTICLSSDRFAVSVTFRANNTPGNATAIEYTADSGLFWFFSSTNIEMLLKIINACSLNQRYWVFAAATTDLEYTITVTDTKTGNVKQYFHAAGTPAPAITDTSAFATCP